MPIILDYSQVAIATIVQRRAVDGEAFDNDLTRHSILDTIRMYNQKHRDEFGEMIIACDGKRSWRRDEFEPYKWSRRESRDAEDEDFWSMLFEVLTEVRDVLVHRSPYRTVYVDGAEADDVIGWVAMREKADALDNFGLMSASSGEKTLIVSTDKDFKQLHRGDRVRQWSPTLKKWVICADPDSFLMDHILRGDSGDGIPNMLSDDKTFVNGERQKMITQPIVSAWMSHTLSNVDTFFRLLREKKILSSLTSRIPAEEIESNFYRNKKLIDLRETPEHINMAIEEVLTREAPKHMIDFRAYLTEKRMRRHMENLSQFEPRRTWKVV